MPDGHHLGAEAYQWPAQPLGCTCPGMLVATCTDTLTVRSLPQARLASADEGSSGAGLDSRVDIALVTCMILFLHAGYTPLQRLGRLRAELEPIIESLTVQHGQRKASECPSSLPLVRCVAVDVLAQSRKILQR